MNKASAIAILTCFASLAAVAVVACTEETTTTPNTGDGGGSSSGDASSGGNTDSGNSGNVDSGSSSGEEAGGGDDGGDGGDSEQANNCSVYCTNMLNNCPARPIPGSGSCLEKCMALTPDQASCRRDHSGRAPTNGSENDHCYHAVGEKGVCE